MKTLTLSFCLMSFVLPAQDPQKEINEQVWKPFIENFNNRNAAGFLAVHSKDVVRSPRDSQTIFGWDAYLKQQSEGDKRGIEMKRQHTLELRFTERIAENDLAIDVGIYKTTSIDSKGQSRSFFGRFHVVLRKENNVWKILVDSDSSEGGTIGEKDFLAAKAF